MVFTPLVSHAIKTLGRIVLRCDFIFSIILLNETILLKVIYGMCSVTLF